MLLLVGLGNPDEKYQRNRHNIGFQIIDCIASHHEFGPEKKKFKGLTREGVIEGHGVRQKAMLLKPGTYYNESGNSVREAASFYKIRPEHIVVFHDELDLAPGKIKVRQGGSAAGNNGIKSIIAHMGPDFIRVRIGIGHPGAKDKVTAHVLSDFSKSEISDWVDDLKDDCVRSLPYLTKGQPGIDKFISTVSRAAQPSKPLSPASEQKKVKKASEPIREPPTEAAAEPAGPFAKLKNLFTKNQ